MPPDTSSHVLAVTNLSLHLDDRVLLDSLNFSIQQGDKIGVVGRNGSGKSTLLRIIQGEIKQDTGEVFRKKDLVVGYLPQSITLDTSLTVRENIREGARYLIDILDAFESLPGLSTKHEELEHMIQLHDGWGLDTRIETVMTQLNCPPPESPIHHLSGGELRRVALARALVSQPDLLVLDEPTNHLDTESIAWLGDFLKSFKGAILLVTHDRYFLDEVTDRMIELVDGTIFHYSGNYTEYLIQKAERETASETTEHRRQMFLRRELEWVRRGPKARTTKSKSRLDKYFEIAGQKGFVADTNIDLVIPPPPQLGNRIVELIQVGMAYENLHLFSHLDLNFEAGQRIGITGRNGLGKTTLLKIIQGQLEPTDGEVRIGPLTQFNYVDQSRVQLNENKTVLEEMSDGSEFVLFGEQRLSLRGYLKRFLFTDERITTQVKYLSGGEKSRLLLARILKQGGNFLILDEPTNDLDLASLRVLEEALIGFPGVVLVVSHDRYFLNRVCTGILAFEGEGKVAYNPGTFDYYLERKKLRQTEVEGRQPQNSQTKKAGQSGKTTPVKRRKLSYKEQEELGSMESTILKIEGRIHEIETLFADPDFHRKHGQQTVELHQEIEISKAKLAKLFKRWEELEALKTEAESFQ